MTRQGFGRAGASVALWIGVTILLASCGKESRASSAKEIESFALLVADNPGLPSDVSGVIIGSDVSLTVPLWTDVTQLAPTVVHTGASLSPASGVAQDFTDPVMYTVTAEDGSTRTYQAAVVVGEPCCGDPCVNPLTDETFCGTSCLSAGPCGANEQCCGGACTDVLASATHCGACLGEGGVSCGSGMDCCGGACRNVIGGDVTNCGACGLVCGQAVTLPNVETYVCSGSTCQVGACSPGYEDCTSDPGCETLGSVITTCPLAVNLGHVSDDPGLNPIEVTAGGDTIAPGQSLWYRVHADDWIGNDWKLLVKLSNITAGVNLDLFAYRRASGNTCTSSPAVTPAAPSTCNENISGCGGGQENSNRCSTNSGNASECVSWFESCVGFLEADETEVWIEVRHVSGGCATFDLKIRNNGNNDTLDCSTY